jgi:hypothetical protein
MDPVPFNADGLFLCAPPLGINGLAIGPEERVGQHALEEIRANRTLCSP